MSHRSKVLLENVTKTPHEMECLRQVVAATNGQTRDDQVMDVDTLDLDMRFTADLQACIPVLSRKAAPPYNFL